MSGCVGVSARARFRVLHIQANNKQKIPVRVVPGGIAIEEYCIPVPNACGYSCLDEKVYMSFSSEHSVYTNQGLYALTFFTQCVCTLRTVYGEAPFSTIVNNYSGRATFRIIVYGDRTNFSHGVYKCSVGECTFLIVYHRATFSHDVYSVTVTGNHSSYFVQEETNFLQQCRVL